MEFERAQKAMNPVPSRQLLLIVKLRQIILCFYHNAFLGYVVPTSERKHFVEYK